MSLDAGIPDPPVRIISGRFDVTEAQVNRMAKDYVVAQWYFSVVKDEVHVTAILLSQGEIRKAQLAQARMPGMRQ
jgi:hypothetical protein